MSASSPGIVRRLFNTAWGIVSWIRVALANLLFLAILGIIIVVLLPRKPAQMADQIALRIAPSGFLVDQRSYTNPMTQLLHKSRKRDAETLVRDLVITLNKAAQDQRITALVLELNHLLGGGISKLEEIGQALQTFKDSGKPIIAISDNYSQEQYYLASYADDIYLHSMGSVLLTGYSSYRTYFKTALDKLSVNFHVFRVGNYKDFIEPYIRDDMSEASREHNAQWLNELWGTYTSRVEMLRKLPAGAINDYIGNLDKNLAVQQGNSAQLALAAGLIDHVKGRVDIHREVIQKVGADPKNSHYRAINYRDYLSHIEREKKSNKDKIGLLVAKGIIVDGEQTAGNIGGDNLARLLRTAREDTDIKALVIRVDSGGGSAFASEIIREEVVATRNAGIPIVVSMGSVTASGGYWITTAADEIWATPTTITGSIGVFGLFPTVEKSLQKLGINIDGLGTTELAGAIRADRALSPIAQDIIQQSVEDIYNHFLKLVAEARESTPEHIHTIAQGRVWSGAMAREIGLVDELGYLTDAVDAAAKRAGVEKYDVKLIEKSLSLQEQLLKDLTLETSGLVQRAVLSLLPNNVRNLANPLPESLKALITINDPRHVYAQCLACTAFY